MTQGSMTIRDRSDELTVTRWSYAGAGIDTSTFETQAALLFANGLILGLPIRVQQTFTRKLNLAGPIGGNAQRELKWALTYEDVQEFLDPGTDTVENPGFGKLYTFEIGTANAAILDPGTDLVAPGSTEFADFESFVDDIGLVSPTGGDVELRKVRLVGRNI